MVARRPIIFGNWKLHNTISDAVTLTKSLVDKLADVDQVEVGVAPVYTALSSVATSLSGSSIRLAAQDCYHQPSGAFTGAVSPPLLRDAGCTYCIVGHSERRQVFGDDDQTVGKKLRACLDARLTPILCVGELESERDAGTTIERVQTQLELGLAQCTPQDPIASLVIAYEPVWAIGTGRTATPTQAQEVHAEIRAWLTRRFSEAAGGIRIMYGGSVKPANAQELLSQADIDGALVGGASLKADSFCDIVRAV